jgi:hypothetical protein
MTKPIFTPTLRSRWLVACVHAGLWLLLGLAIAGLRGKSPDYRDAVSVSTPVQSPAPVAKLLNLFSPGVWPASLADTNQLNPFFTRHFFPAQAPPLPPPTTKKIEVTYQGFYQPVDGARHVIAKVGDAYVDSPLGARLTANLFAVEATMQSLILTNAAAQTNLLLLNTKKEMEVPIQ